MAKNFTGFRLNFCSTSNSKIVPAGGKPSSTGQAILNGLQNACSKPDRLRHSATKLADLRSRLA